MTWIIKKNIKTKEKPDLKQEQEKDITFCEFARYFNQITGEAEKLKTKWTTDK